MRWSSIATCSNGASTPQSAHRIPQITAHDQVVILFCDEGYASSLAAASLQQLGLRNATDLTGGIQAWIAPVCRSSPTVTATFR